MRVVTSVVGAVVEAWAELRVNRLRVLLSLLGVAVAVAAITATTGVGALAEQSARESQERYQGRPATFVLEAYATGGASLDPADVDDAFSSATARHGITWTSVHTYAQREVQFADGVVEVPTEVVEVPFAEMHRLRVAEGSWFTERDADRLAPALVVNDAFWQRLGAPEVATHPTVRLLGADAVTAVVVGVTPAPGWEESPAAFMLPVDRDLRSATALAGGYGDEQPQHEMWVPEGDGEALGELVRSEVASALGDDVDVVANRQDYAAGQEGDPFLPVKLAIGGVGVLVLLLGGLGLVNIALVTVRQRIREIGVRRSFGATAPRVFFSVMLESVAGTVLAGLAGVAVAVAVVQDPTVQGFIAQGPLEDVPPFPVGAAVLGLVSATVIGAVAGLLPALVAVRVKVIDAIRY
ncbi:ABC transporter permease [Frigoribacterium salinisoli]